MIQLIHFRLCPKSRSIRLALAELRIDVELKDERPWEWRQEFVRLNPAGEVPVLVEEDGRPICGAYAISEYLAEAGGHVQEEGGLFPGDRERRAEARRLVDWFQGKLDREATEVLLEGRLYSRLKAGASGAPDAETLRNARTNLRYHMRYLDHLSEERDWLSGPEMSFADLCAASQISCLDYLGEIDWSDQGFARQWYARMKSRPSLRAILSERVPGAPAPPAHYADPDF
jgi:glutathione S-transferase